MILVPFDFMDSMSPNEFKKLMYTTTLFGFCISTMNFILIVLISLNKEAWEFGTLESAFYVIKFMSPLLLTELALSFLVKKISDKDDLRYYTFKNSFLNIINAIGRIGFIMSVITMNMGAFYNNTGGGRYFPGLTDRSYFEICMDTYSGMDSIIPYLGLALLVVYITYKADQALKNN